MSLNLNQPISFLSYIKLIEGYKEALGWTTIQPTISYQRIDDEDSEIAFTNNFSGDDIDGHLNQLYEKLEKIPKKLRKNSTIEFFNEGTKTGFKVKW